MLPSVKRSEIICVNNLEKMSARRTSNNGRNCIDVSPYGSRRGSKDKPTDQHASRDGTRSFTYSAKHAPVYPLLWPKTEYSRLQTKAKLKTLDDKLNEFKLNELEKKNLLEASDKRKKHLQEIDRERQSNSGVLGNVFNEIVEHDKDLTSRKIIDRAFVAKQEQEEEVKRANRIILAAKCHIIRDAQIAEKQEIERELRAEELRLERIMLDENEKALKEEEQKAYLDKQRITQHSEEIRNQLLEKEKMKLKEAERIEEEARVLKKTERAMQIARDEMDHRKAVEQLKHEEQKETDNVHKLLQLREKYREEIIRQINQKEQERREKERCLKKEHSMMQDLTKKREMNIKSTIANKIKIMKESKVPERFIKDVERQLESIRTE
ncbi:cilia- and flagella-associated protein 45 isoform X2 [Toxorhynchites rutilus septentrionalis]|uniref:cilia- and flagella-associated protein 45 isoform X2 n=1 Tax=Toxorhynchites rutilus septentrionalis TaxID=329112 RepID=UPI0024797E0D|nr:cilia- and flagella-associated protein 45 isoform X2 [Toxorhynchites rutilus septentrionalis]